MNNIQHQIDRINQGIQLEIIHPENILIPCPEWLEEHSLETFNAMKLAEKNKLHTVGLIPDCVRKSLHKEV